jgi:hypothetical protein
MTISATMANPERAAGCVTCTSQPLSVGAAETKIHNGFPTSEPGILADD